MTSTPDRLPAARFTWEKVLRSASLSKRAATTGYALATWADSDGTHARPGVQNLMEATRYGKRSILMALAELQASGYVDQIRRGRAYGRGGGGFASEYRLTLPAETLLPSYPQEAPGEDENKVQSVQNKVQSTTELGAICAEQGALGCTPPDHLTPTQESPRHEHQAAAAHQEPAALAEPVDSSAKADEIPESVYGPASQFLGGRPDLGQTFIDQARTVLGQDADRRALVVLAAQIAGWPHPSEVAA